VTSQKQIDANRRNALLSTGPRTEEGKATARQNALSHGLTAATVIIGLEDAAEYDAFEAEIVTDYDPKSAVERELTRRLASLLWRLRRANLIEAGLFSFSEAILATEQQPDLIQRSRTQVSEALIRRLKLAPICSDQDRRHDRRDVGPKVGENDESEPSTHRRSDQQRAMTMHYLRLANMGSLPLERIGRYEASLWRQFIQVLFALDKAKCHRIAASRGRFTPYPPQW
jgi:hypothetical protein